MVAANTNVHIRYFSCRKFKCQYILRHYCQLLFFETGVRSSETSSRFPQEVKLLYNHFVED